MSERAPPQRGLSRLPAAPQALAGCCAPLQPARSPPQPSGVLAAPRRRDLPACPCFWLSTRAPCVFLPACCPRAGGTPRNAGRTLPQPIDALGGCAACAAPSAALPAAAAARRSQPLRGQGRCASSPCMPERVLGMASCSHVWPTPQAADWCHPHAGSSCMGRSSVVLVRILAKHHRTLSTAALLLWIGFVVLAC